MLRRALEIRARYPALKEVGYWRVRRARE